MCIYKLSTVVICLCRVLLVTGPWHDLFTVLVWKKMLLLDIYKRFSRDKEDAQLEGASTSVHQALGSNPKTPTCSNWSRDNSTHRDGITCICLHTCVVHTCVVRIHMCKWLTDVSHCFKHTILAMLMSCTTTFKVRVMRRETAESSLHTHHKVFVLSPPLPKWKNK